jgi:hypothetical protein
MWLELDKLEAEAAAGRAAKAVRVAAEKTTPAAGPAAVKLSATAVSAVAIKAAA